MHFKFIIRQTRVQEYKLRQEELKKEYDKINQIITNQTYSKDDITKAVKDTVSFEENTKKITDQIKDEEKKIGERKRENRDLVDFIAKTVKRLNEKYAKIYGEKPVQVIFDPEKDQLTLVLTCASSPLEQLELQSKALAKTKKEELTQIENKVTQLKEEVKLKNKENELTFRENEQLLQDLNSKKKKMDDINEQERKSEDIFKKDIGKAEEMIRKVEGVIDELAKEVLNLTEELNKAKAQYQAVAIQRKKDKEDTDKIVDDFIKEAIECKLNMIKEYTKIPTILHNFNIELRQSSK